jgi:hypothetical protein
MPYAGAIKFLVVAFGREQGFDDCNLRGAAFVDFCSVFHKAMKRGDEIRREIMIINSCDDRGSPGNDETDLGGEVFAELLASFRRVRGFTESRDLGESIFY